MSDLSGSPSTNFNPAPYNYVLVDGTVIADDWDELTDGSLDNLISLDETGTAQTGYVWTGTNTNG